MSLSVPNTAKAVLIGASNFPKDDTLSPIEQADSNIKSIAQVLADPSIIGVHVDNITKMLDVSDNTKIKEEVSIAAEEAKGALVVYITGHITTRKGHLYLATPNSSRKKIHINGIALDELLDIISETNAENRILIFDAYYSDVNDEETEGDVVIDALKHYEGAYLNTFIISASPSSNFVGFKGNGTHTAFTEALLNTLNNGLDKEQESLTLEDIHEGIKDQVLGQMPVKSTASKADRIVFAHNTKFLGFNELKMKADKFFDKEQFQEALETYEEAAKLFGKNTEVKKRRKFIKRFLEGEKAIEKGNFEKAKEAFLEASAVFEMKVVTEKINGVLMTIANTLFDKEEYELARENYKMVATYLPEDAFIKERLEKCDHELRFLDLIDEADKCYFEDEFEKALDFYQKALEIHSDRKAAKRRDECERLLNKAAAIRKKIQEEHGSIAKVSKEDQAKLEQNLRKSIEKELSTKLEKEIRTRVEKELKSNIDQKTQEEEIKFDKQLWSNISLANSLDVYEFFIQYYPKSAFIDKAKERLEYLLGIVSKQKQKAELYTETPKVEESEVKEKPDESQNKSEDSPKKHKPFIKEEKGRSHISEEKPYDILEELEAQFNGGDQPADKKVIKKEEKADSPEDLINRVMKKAEKIEAPDKKEEKKEEVKPVVEAKKEPEVTKAETPPVVEKKAEPKPEPKVEKKETPIASTITPVYEEKKQFSEEELWQNAIEANSVDGYRFYVDNTKESEHLVDAYYQINKLSRMADAGVLDTEKKEPVAEVKPVTSETIETPDSYSTTTTVDSEPTDVAVSAPVETVTPVIETSVSDDNEEETLWKKALEVNTVNAYYEYVANSREKGHLEEAKEKIASLKENARESEKGDWDRAESENTIDAYKTYIKKYPLGHYYAKAMFRISELEAQL